jgi:transposase-like protein
MLNGGLGLTEAARRLSISSKTLANWVSAAKHGKSAKAGVTRKSVSELEAEDGARHAKKSDGVVAINNAMTEPPQAKAGGFAPGAAD